MFFIALILALKRFVADEIDDMNVIEAKVRRLKKLNFLSIATYQVKINDTKRLDDEQDDW